MVLSLFLFAFSASAQDEAEIETYFAETKLGESFNFNERIIRFKEVLVDSRCPSDVTCVRAGEAKILVEIFKDEKSLGKEIITLGANVNSFKTNLAKFFEKELDIEILSLSPYPKTSRKIEASDYQLKLKVTKRLEN
ncbi:hypothetical protein [Salegentibacter salarius]|uniref:hypothetical protein n=1 Tax=Salegentibacter salarius TaxID=435906 RepID=UPI00114CE980|nr:hypothetical protein [Salegentibacter salarius]